MGGVIHPQRQPGQYFYFSRNDWAGVFGSAPSGQQHLVDQIRNGAQIWSGTVYAWDNHNGVHGRRVNGSAAGQWRVNDVIRPRASPTTTMATTTTTTQMTMTTPILATTTTT